MRLNVFRPNKIEMLKHLDDIFKIIPEGFILSHQKDTDENLEFAFKTLNWSCWTDKKPIECFSEITTCTSGDLILNPDRTKDFYICMGVGWKKFDNFSEMFNWLKQKWDNPKAFLIIK